MCAANFHLRGKGEKFSARRAKVSFRDSSTGAGAVGEKARLGTKLC